MSNSGCPRQRCLNGGTCQFLDNEFFCQCPGMFYGDRCQRDVAMTTTFVLIGIAILLAIAACLIIAYCQRFRAEQDRPPIINRIISVRVRRRTTKIDKSKNDLPPAYDDVSHTGDVEAETDVNTADNREIDQTICKVDDITAPTCDDRITSDEELNVQRAQSGTDRDGEVTDTLTQSSNTGETDGKEYEDQNDQPPGYCEVQKNRASKRILDETHEESDSHCNKPDDVEKDA